MALPSGLTLYTYTLPAATPPVMVAYMRELDTLSFSTVAPGGCGDLTARIKLANPKLPQPNLSLLARVALQAPMSPQGRPHNTIWQGETTDPELNLSQTDGDFVNLGALGMGNAMRDDPRNDAYNAQTIAQMVAQQLSSRSSFLVLDQDTSGVVPRTTSTSSPQYANSNMEEVVTNLALLDGDDMWGVWPHPRNRDAVGFPTAQLLLHARDTATVAYSALEWGDIVSWRIIPSAERAYNVIKIGYNDPGASPPVSYAWAVDSRLSYTTSGGLPVITGQGTAPFRVRTYFQDYSGIATMSATLAQSIANQYLALFKNPTNKIELVLRGVRDLNGNPVPLYTVWADSNILVPALAVRGTPLPTASGAGTNLFYIVETRYEENSGGEVQLTLQCDNFVDTVAIQVARLQLQADTDLRQGLRTTGTVQALGAPLKAHAGGIAQTSAGAQTVGFGVNYGVTLTQLPTAFSLTTTTSTNANLATLAVTASDYAGCTISWQSNAGGVSEWEGSIQTVGN